MTTYEWVSADNERGHGCWSAPVARGELLATERSYGMALGHSPVRAVGRFKLREVTWIVDVEIKLPAANLADAKFRAQRLYERALIAEQVAVDEVNDFYDLTQDEALAGQVAVDEVNDFYDLTQDEAPAEQLAVDPVNDFDDLTQDEAPAEQVAVDAMNDFDDLTTRPPSLAARAAARRDSHRAGRRR